MPPTGSRLAMYVEHCDTLAAEGMQAWSSPDDDIRALAIHTMIEAEPRLWAMPFPFVRWLTASAYGDLGMPAEGYPPWLEMMLDDAGAHTVAANKAGLETRVSRLLARIRPAQKPKRRGRPKTNSFELAITFAAYVDVLTSATFALSENKRFELAGARLGVDRFYVRRKIDPHLRGLVRLDAPRRELALVAAARTVHLMHEFDLRNPPKRSLESKIQRASGY